MILDRVSDSASEVASLNRQQFVRLVTGVDAFPQLAAEIGGARAEEIAGLMYERQARDTNPDGRYVRVPGHDLDRFAQRMALMVSAECSQIAAKRAYAGELLGAARDGILRKRLADMSVSDRSLMPKPRHTPREARELDIVKAANWIGRTMHGEGRDAIVREVLAEHVTNAPAGEVLGRTPEMLDRIYARIYPNAPQWRSPNPDVTYPSSVGGRHLLETIFGWTAEAVWPLPGDERWFDVALFYLGAIGTVQGFADGNKRAARMAYAITVLRGRCRFVAPAEQLERDLIRMHGPDPQQAVG